MQSLTDNLQQSAVMYPKHDVLDNTDTIGDTAVHIPTEDQRMLTDTTHPNGGSENAHGHYRHFRQAVTDWANSEGDVRHTNNS